MGGVGAHSIPHTVFTCCAHRASQVIEQQVGSVRQIRPAQKFPCLQVRLTALPVTQMSCEHVSCSRSGGRWVPSVTRTPSMLMRTCPSVSAVNV